MSINLDGHVARIKQLVHAQSSLLYGFSLSRWGDSTLIDVADQRRRCVGYIEWSAMAAEAAVVNLNRRKWESR